MRKLKFNVVDLHISNPMPKVGTLMLRKI